MTEPVKRAVVDAFYKAYAERDVEAVAAFIGNERHAAARCDADGRRGAAAAAAVVLHP
jgi:hypothetical protein